MMKDRIQLVEILYKSSCYIVIHEHVYYFWKKIETVRLK